MRDKYSLVVDKGDAYFGIRGQMSGARESYVRGCDMNYEPLIRVPDEATVEDVIHAFRSIRKREFDRAQSSLCTFYKSENRAAERVAVAGRTLDAVDIVIRKIK